MIDELIHLLVHYEFAQNALIAGILVAIVAGLVSRFVVARNMSFAVHALAEVGFTGSAGFILIGLSPVLGLLSGSMLTALLIGGLGLRIRERDAVVGVIMAFGLGLGVLFITLYPHYATEAFTILFGAITAVSRGDLMLLVVVGAVTIAGLGAMYRPLTFATVDPVVAEARGVPVRLVSILFLLLLAAAVAEAVQVV
jgi:zinc/manganese transport system permease protein